MLGGYCLVDVALVRIRATCLRGQKLPIPTRAEEGDRYNKLLVPEK